MTKYNKNLEFLIFSDESTSGYFELPVASDLDISVEQASISTDESVEPDDEAAKIANGSHDEAVSVMGKAMGTVEFAVRYRWSGDVTVEPKVWRILKACGLEPRTFTTTGLGLEPLKAADCNTLTITHVMVPSCGTTLKITTYTGCAGNYVISSEAAGKVVKIAFTFQGKLFTQKDVPIDQGDIAGTVTVDGASQTGTSLDVTGFTAGSGTVKKGTRLIIDGLNNYFPQVTADATITANAATLVLDEALPLSPADTASITFEEIISTTDLVNETQNPEKFLNCDATVMGDDSGLLNAFSFDAGNNVVAIPSQEDETAIDHFFVQSKAPRLTITQLMGSEDVANLTTLWKNNTEAASKITIPNISAPHLEIILPKSQILSRPKGDIDGIQSYEITLKANGNRGTDAQINNEVAYQIRQGTYSS